MVLTVMISHYQYSWRNILELNGNIPETRNVTDSLSIRLPSSVCNRITLHVSFAFCASLIKSQLGYIPVEWRHVCSLEKPRGSSYTPRWTLSMFYIQGDLVHWLKNKAGLDIGAISGCPPLQNVSLCMGIPKQDPRIIDIRTPHFQYYSENGAHMTAIDIRASHKTHPKIRYGDIRLLHFTDEEFDFLTIPMILGTGNPCDTYLDVALAMAEMWRVTKPGGFTYIADSSFSPVLALAAQEMGYVVYCSKGSEYGLPIGTFLYRPRPSQKQSWFTDIFVSSGLHQITLESKENIQVRNCNLLLDRRFPEYEVL